MGISKLGIHVKEDIDVAGLSKALSHPARIAILNFLIERKSCVCGSIVEEIQLSQSTISQHLSVLKESGLVKGEISGVSVCYCIHQENWAAAQQILNTFFDSFEGSKTCC